MRRQDFRGILACFCGPIQERILPDCILQLILEISGHVKIARQAIRFNIFFPPIHYKAWVCSDPDCGFNIKIRNGDVYLNEPIASGASHSPRMR